MSSRHKMKTYSQRSRNIEEGAHKPVGLGHALLDASPDIGRNTVKSGLISLAAGGSGHSSFNTGIIAAANSDLSLTKTKQSTTGNVMQTPFPTEGSDFGVFKLGTSRALPVSPGHRFSPVPLVESSRSAAYALRVNGRAHVNRGFQRSRNGTTSRRLKENMRPKPSKNAHISASETLKVLRHPLASPFTSRPSSPVVQAVAQRSTTKLDHESRLAPRPVHRQSLSDTCINQGLDLNVSISGASSANTHSALESKLTSLNQGNTNVSVVSLASIQRRPSAPSLRHHELSSLAPPVSLNVYVPAEAREGDGHNVGLNRRANSAMNRLASYEFLCGSESYFNSSLDGAVDFNRPPSQMSFYGGEIDSDSSKGGLFMHIQGRSTPKISRSVPRNALLLQPVEPINNGESLASQKSVESVQTLEKKQYSPWISDSIISPPSYYKQQKNYDLSVLERTLENMDLTLPISLLGAAATNAPAPERSEGTSVDNVLGENTEGSLLSPHRSWTLVTEPGVSMPNWHKPIDSATHNDPGGETSTQIPAVPSHSRAIPGFSRTRSGTIVQKKINGGRIADRRTRSGTITQGGGGTRRTRSGTIVQATKEGGYNPASEPRHSQGACEGHLSENDESRDEVCSCRSSDDELMLRSHSHYDVSAEDLDWKVAEPPSPVVKRLKRAKRRNALKRQKEKGKRSNPDTFGIMVEGDDREDGIDGDIEDDELDFFGNFVPENW